MQELRYHWRGDQVYGYIERWHRWMYFESVEAYREIAEAED